jgi:hypothetical protein
VKSGRGPGIGGGCVCHAETVPGVASVEALVRVVAEFVVADLELVAEPAAVAAAQRSLDDSGLLLLGKVHSVRDNPLLARALMQAFGLWGWRWNGMRTWHRSSRPSWPPERWPTTGCCGREMAGSPPGTWSCPSGPTGGRQPAQHPECGMTEHAAMASRRLGCWGGATDQPDHPWCRRREPRPANGEHVSEAPRAAPRRPSRKGDPRPRA